MARISILFSILILATLSGFPPSSFAETSGERTYIVLYAQHQIPADASSAIERAGGTLVYSYDEIGVAIARSESLEFDVELRKDQKVEGVSLTAAAAFSLDDGFAIETADPLLLDQDNTVASWGDQRSSRQWDMLQIHVPEAHAVTTGSPAVVVGGIDSGINPLHPDLAPNVDWDLSVSCVGGVPNQDPAAWRDDNGHGTFTAGAIAAAINGVGIVGVAPNVRFAAIKGCNENARCLPDNVICSFMWAADHGIDVVSNSYGVRLSDDEPTYNCRNEAERYVALKAVARAVSYAQQRGVTVVAGSGNDNVDLTHLTGGLTNACNRIPIELAGVIGVSGNGSLMQKAYYTNYGVGAVDVVAPAGDDRFQRTEAARNGMVLSTTMQGGYAFGFGTSMAVPHVAGVAALIISQYGKMPPGQVRAIIEQTADPVPCPEKPFNPGPPFDWPAECQGGEGYNSFYGHGQVNAFRAVTRSPQGGRYTKLVAFPMSAHGTDEGGVLPAAFGVFNAGNSPELVSYEIVDTSGWLPNPILGQVDLDAGTGYRIDFEVQVPMEGGSSVATLDAVAAISGSPQDQVMSEILLPEPSEKEMLVAGLGCLMVVYLVRQRW